MELFLQIVGGVVITLILLAVAFYLYLKMKIGKYLNYEPQRQPLYIHLTEDLDPEWLKKNPASQMAADMEQLGFEAGNAYTIYEMPAVVLKAFTKDNINAVLYQHEIAGCWIDMCFDEVDGNEYTCSNCPMGSEVEKRPECIKSYNSGATVQEVYQEAQGIIATLDKDLALVDLSSFREHFENSYKKDMSWKARKGGLGYEEYLAIVEKDVNFKTSKENIEEGFVQMKEAELFEWAGAAIEEYANQVSKRVDEIYEMGEFLIVPFKTHMPAYLNYLECKCFVTDDQKEKLEKVYAKETDVEGVFAKINDLLSPDMRADHVADIDYPLPMKLYKISEKMLHAAHY